VLQKSNTPTHDRAITFKNTLREDSLNEREEDDDEDNYSQDDDHEDDDIDEMF
jgi:hypothetical protein